MNVEERLEPIGYEAALKKAWDDVSGSESSMLSEMADAPLVEDGIIVPFLGKDYLVNIGNKEITLRGEEVPPFIAVLILHYLRGCGPRRPSEEFITFREIPGGEMYYPAFKKRAIDRIARTFGRRSQRLLKAGVHLDAERLEMGDASIEVRAFPKISVAVVVWEGDEEVPASANILFDSAAPEILPMEDLSVVGNLVASILVKQIEKSETPPIDRLEVQGRG
ncbi:MAG TPA: DUF3786 domain-containing protein [Methanomassiliicoccales archaeon]|nr:DUF3786 domain-containing protein [Methanomassiliicoccales archaeon]